MTFAKTQGGTRHDSLVQERSFLSFLRTDVCFHFHIFLFTSYNYTRFHFFKLKFLVDRQMFPFRDSIVKDLQR